MSPPLQDLAFVEEAAPVRAGGRVRDAVLGVDVGLEPLPLFLGRGADVVVAKVPPYALEGGLLHLDLLLPAGPSLGWLVLQLPHRRHDRIEVQPVELPLGEDA